jgi:hypothetical protein
MSDCNRTWYGGSLTLWRLLRLWSASSFENISGMRSRRFAAALNTGSEYSARSRTANWDCSDIFGGYPFILSDAFLMMLVTGLRVE